MRQFCYLSIFIFSMFSGSAKEPTETGQPAEAKPVDPMSADSPMFRGSQSLAGVFPGKLPRIFSLKWEQKTNGAVIGSPAVVGERVYVACAGGRIYALNIADGTKIWSYDMGGGTESSPLVLNERVYCGSGDGILYALDANTGKEVWKYETGAEITGGPNYAFVPSEDLKSTQLRILIGSHDNMLHAVDIEGKQVWVYETDNFVNGTPAVANGKAIFGGCDGLLHIVDVATGKSELQADVGSYVPGSASTDGKFAFVGHHQGEFVCIDLEKGRRIWAFPLEGDAIFSTAAIASDRVVFGGRDNRLHCISRADGNERWNFRARGKIDSSPIIVGDEVACGSEDGRVYVVSLSEGKERWSYDIGSPVTASLTFARGLLIVGGEDGRVYAFGQK